MKDFLYQYNPWWDGLDAFSGLKSRQIYTNELINYIDSRHIIFLSGLRRVGKTTLMHLVIKQLLDKEIDPKHIFYASLDNYLFGDMNIFEIIDAYRMLHKIPKSKKIYLFLDEIAYIDKFQQQLKNIYDSQNAKIFASSSSSSLLRDSKALLTGRSYTLMVKPLSFEEYLDFKGIKIHYQDLQLTDSYFLDYCKTGGMPEHVLLPTRTYLPGIINDIIEKDIISYHNLRNSSDVKDYFKYLMSCSGSTFSLNQASKVLGISPDTSKRYFEYFENCFLIHSLPRWDTKLKERLRAVKKIYAADLGMKYIHSGSGQVGRYFENYAYIQLMENNVYYYFDSEFNSEIDFYLPDFDTLVEVKYQSELRQKQQAAYDNSPARNKYMLDNFEKLKELQRFFKTAGF